MKKRKTNRQNKEVLRITQMFQLILVAVSFSWVFFCFVLALHGGWGDIGLAGAIGAPILASLALIVAIYRIYQQKQVSEVAIAPLAALGTSALFFCFVAVIEVMNYVAMI